MQYNPPVGATDPNAAYVQGNPALGIVGSKPPAIGFEGAQREIVNALTAGGLTPTNADMTQLAQLFAQCAKLSGFGASLTANGYQRLPSGLIIQWGIGTLPNSGGTISSVGVTLPIAFPSAIFSVSGSCNGNANSAVGFIPAFGAQSLNVTGFSATGELLGGNSNSVFFNQTVPFNWMALGY